MSEQLGALFHWSPVSRREAILREGLRPFCEPTVASGPQPYISLGPTPSAAWGLSGDMDWMADEDQWDLWQVRLRDGDDVRARLDFAPRIVEIKVHTVIPPDRLWWVGQRTPWLCR